MTRTERKTCIRLAKKIMAMPGQGFTETQIAAFTIGAAIVAGALDSPSDDFLDFLWNLESRNWDEPESMKLLEQEHDQLLA